MNLMEAIKASCTKISALSHKEGSLYYFSCLVFHGKGVRYVACVVRTMSEVMHGNCHTVGLLPLLICYHSMSTIRHYNHIT